MARRFIMLALLVVAILIAAGAQLARAAGPNVLQNGGFETATGLLPDFWDGKKLNLGAAQDGQDCTTASEGACSMRLTSDGNGSKLIQTLGSGAGGESYILTFDASSVDAGGEGRNAIWVKLYYNNGSKEKHKLDLPRGTNDWTSYQIAFTTARDYRRIEIHIRYSLTRGFSWFDNFSMNLQ